MLGKELTILEKSLMMQPKQANPWLKKMKEDLVLKRSKMQAFKSEEVWFTTGNLRHEPKGRGREDRQCVYSLLCSMYTSRTSRLYSLLCLT